MNEFEIDIEVLEKLCEKHDLLLSDPLINLIVDVILNKEGVIK
jgi:hypothetical protein